MSSGIRVRRWGLRVAIGVGVLWILWVLAGSPWTTFGLWYDAVKHEALFQQAAAEVRCCRSPAGAGANEKAAVALGYTSIEVDNGVVLFIKYQRFMGKGVLGLAYGGSGLKETVDYNFFATPPHWPFLRMPNGFYVLGGK